MAKKLKSLNPIIGTGYKTLSTIKDGEDGNIENFPDTLPKIPRLSYKRLGVSGLEIGWEFEDKIYYTYELYGSTTKGFEASEENLMFQGLASSYFYEAKPGEKWYFKARAKNTHGRYTEFSSELVAYTVKLDNLGEYVEGGAINGALIENATINNAHIKDLHADKITAGVLDADRIGANSITANKIEANAITSEKIQAKAITTDKLAANIIASNHIQSGTIESGHIKAGTIESDHIKSNSINSNHIQANTIQSEHIQANTIQSEHIQTGAITAGSGIIAEGAIGSAQISSLDAAKIEAGTIDTSKVTIQGADGHLRLKGNRMQVFQGTGNQAKERVSLGDVNGNGSIYGLRVRGADGTTILLDENGVTSEGITDGSITNDKISDNAEIDGAKLNINSVVSCINEDGTEVIKGTKISVNGTNLETKLSSIETTQSTQGSTISQHSSKILANEKAIALKVDSQTYTTDKNNMTTQLNKNTSAINVLQDEIALKVEQTDITNAINGVQVGGRNLALKTNQGVIGWDWGLQTGGKTITEIVENGIKCCKMVRDNVESTGWSYICFNQINRNKYLPSKKYTISFDVKSSIVTSFYIGLKEGSSSNPLCSDVKTGNTVANKWTRLSATITTKDTLPASTSQILYLNSMNSNVGVSYIFRNLIIVEGDKATDWTPAPEDITSEIDTKINTAKAEIKVTTDAISQNVSNLSQTVSNKADGSIVTTLSNKVGSLETSVNGISGKVTNLEKTTTNLGNSVSGVQGEVETLKSDVASLEVTTSGISQKVSSVESTTATLTTKVTDAQNSANSANSKIDGLQVGGRNIFKNSGFTQGTSSWNTYSCNNLQIINEPLSISGKAINFVSTGGGIYQRNTVGGENTPYPNGENYTVSGYVKCSSTAELRVALEGVTTKYVRPSSANTWVYFSHQFTGNGTAHTFTFYGVNGNVYTLKDLKLEKGNKPTDWSPAPEDVDGAINSVDGKVTTLQGEYNTTKSKVATLETNLDGITQRVSSTESTTTTLTNRVNTVESTANTAKSTADTANNNATNALNTANSTNTKLNNLQIGGRNLALGTGKATGDVSSGHNGSPYSATDLFSGITAIKTNTAWSGRLFNLKAIAQRGGFKTGDNLVLSVYIKADQNVTLRVSAHRTTGTGNTAGSDKIYDNFTVTPKWQQVWFPFVADEGSLNRTDTRIEVNIATGNNYIHWAGWKLEKGTKPSDWSPAPEDVDSNIDDVKNSLNNFQNTVNTTFKDGIIEEAEAKAIAQHLKTLDAEKADIDKEYSAIYSNANLTGSAKTNLASAKTSFDSAHASLKSTINTVISDGRVSSSESASVTSTFNTYNTQLGVYKQRIQEALDAIGSAKVDNIQIGGRNLAKNSIVVAHSGTLNKDDYVSSGTLISTITGTHQGFRFDSQSIYEPNQKYVLSFNIQKQSGTINQLGMIHNGKGLRNISVVCDGVAKGDFVAANTSVGTILNDGAVHKIEVYYTTPATIPADTGVSYTYIQLNKESGTSCSAKFTNFKLEKGIKATDWTPAPEDIDGAISAVDGKVTTLQGTVNTTNSKVATLETNLNGITQRVSATETTTSSLTSQMNNKENKNDRVIYAKGNGNDAPNNSQVKVGSNTLVNGHGRGLNILALNPITLEQYYNGRFDTYGGDNYRTQFAEKIQELNNGNYIIVVTSHDSACLNYDTVCNALYLIGGSAPNTSIPSYREAYALIGKSKLGKGNGLEMYIPKTATDARVAEVSVKVSDQGALLGVNSNNSESKIDTLTTRVSTAESKLTKDSLTTTIGNHYTTSTDVNGIVTSKGYQTESEVQQTVNGLQVKVQQSGGYNLLKNSGFKNGLSSWGTQSHNSPTGGEIKVIDNNGEWRFPSTEVKTCQIRLSNQTGKEYGISQSFKTVVGKKYTISFYYAGHRVPNANMIIRGTTSSTSSWLTSQGFNPMSYSATNGALSNWGYFTHTFTAQLDAQTLNIVINTANDNGYMWITQPQIEEGELANPYSPNPNEVYDGITTIDKDGVTVTSSNVKSKTNMSANGFKITKTDTNEDVFKVNSDGTLYMKGQITVTGGSVPTSNLSGTISSNQLNSSITSDINNAKNNASSALSTANTASTNATNALNTANSVNSTVNSNKDNWSNAYNRVKEWASGAVTGTTNINGGMIATDTITAKQMAIGDFNNYSQLAKGKNLVNRYGTANWTEGTNSHSYWQTTNEYFPFTVNETLNPFKAGDKIQIKFDAYTPSTRNVNVGVWFYSDTSASSYTGAVTGTVSCSASWGTKTVNLTLPTGNTYVQNAKSIAILIQNGSSGERIEVRNATVNRLVAGDLIVNGTITTDHIHTNGLNANVIKAGIISADRLDANTIVSKVNGGTTEINGNRIQTGTLSASKITTGTLDASKVNVTNLNASNIKSGKLSANYIDATNLSVKGELLSGQINGVGGIKFAQGAVISSYDSHVSGYKGIQISAPSIKLGDKVDIYSPTLISTVTGKSSTSSTSSSWTMSNSGGLNCSTVNTTGTTTVGGTLNVRNNMINGMNNLQIGRGSVNIPIFGSSSNFDYIKGGRSTIAFADTGPIHFLYNGTKSSFIAGGTVYLPHAGNTNCDHLRLGAGIIASPSSGSFHFLTANGNTSPLYAGVLYSATTLSLKEPMVMSNNSAFDKINSINVIETKNGLRLHNPISMVDAIDESSEVVKTVYNEEKDEIKTSIDYTSAISTLWKAVQELKQENDELKEIIKSLCPKESDFFKDATDC